MILALGQTVRPVGWDCICPRVLSIIAAQMATYDGPLGDIATLEADLWEAADNLRANWKLTSSEYCMPVPGVIFLRLAANRFEAASKQIEADQASGKMPKRKVRPEDYVTRRSLFLPEATRYDKILATPKVADLGEADCGIDGTIQQCLHVFGTRSQLVTTKCRGQLSSAVVAQTSSVAPGSKFPSAQIEP